MEPSCPSQQPGERERSHRAASRAAWGSKEGLALGSFDGLCQKREDFTWQEKEVDGTSLVV